jgi:hypothetical protein
MAIGIQKLPLLAILPEVPPDEIPLNFNIKLCG